MTERGVCVCVCVSMPYLDSPKLCLSAYRVPRPPSLHCTQQAPGCPRTLHARHTHTHTHTHTFPHAHRNFGAKHAEEKRIFLFLSHARRGVRVCVLVCVCVRVCVSPPVPQVPPLALPTDHLHSHRSSLGCHTVGTHTHTYTHTHTHTHTLSDQDAESYGKSNQKQLSSMCVCVCACVCVCVCVCTHHSVCVYSHVQSSKEHTQRQTSGSAATPTRLHAQANTRIDFCPCFT